MGSLQAGQFILVEVSDLPVPSVTDTMGDNFVPRGEVPLSGSTYDLEVFVAIASQSGSDSVHIAGAGGFPALIVHGITGGIASLGSVSYQIASGDSATPQMSESFFLPGELIIAALLLPSDEGKISTTVSAGPGYTLLTGGSANLDEEMLATAHSSAAPFSLGSPLSWAEVMVSFEPAYTASPVPQFGAPAILVAAIGLVVVAVMKRGKVLKFQE